MVAWGVGFSGLGLSLWIGTSVLGLEIPDLLLCVLAANVAGYVGGLLTLEAEQVSWVRSRILNHPLKTWALLAILFFGIQCGIAPALWDWRNLCYLFFPLIMSTGLMLNWAFGPTRDWQVRRAQLRAQAPTRETAQATAND